MFSTDCEFDAPPHAHPVCVQGGIKPKTTALAALDLSHVSFQSTKKLPHKPSQGRLLSTYTQLPTLRAWFHPFPKGPTVTEGRRATAFTHWFFFCVCVCLFLLFSFPSITFRESWQQETGLKLQLGKGEEDFRSIEIPKTQKIKTDSQRKPLGTCSPYHCTSSSILSSLTEIKNSHIQIKHRLD